MCVYKFICSTLTRQFIKLTACKILGVQRKFFDNLLNQAVAARAAGSHLYQLDAGSEPGLVCSGVVYIFRLPE